MILSILLARKIASLFVIMLMGFTLVKMKILRPEDSSYLSTVMIKVVLPCCLLKSFQIDAEASVIQGMLVGILWAFIGHFLFMLITRILRKPCHLTVGEAGAIVYPNGGNLLIPIVISVFGPEWVIYSSSFVIVQAILIWTMGYTSIGQSKKIPWKNIATNPNLIAIVIGVVMLLLHVQLPALVQDALSDTMSMMGPLSMLVIGILIAGMDMKEVFTNPRNWIVSGIRLILCPLILIALMKVTHSVDWVENGETIMMISMLAGASCTAALVTQITQMLRSLEEAQQVSAITVLNTLLCILTMPVMIFLFQM